jgi:hypothetical protein
MEGDTVTQIPPHLQALTERQLAFLNDSLDQFVLAARMFLDSGATADEAACIIGHKFTERLRDESVKSGRNAVNLDMPQLLAVAAVRLAERMKDGGDNNE